MSDPTNQAMQTLTAQYYNALCTGVGLSPDTFQLAQGSIALPVDSQGLWQILDSIPPASINQYWSSGQYNSFSSNYGSVLSCIQSAAASGFLAAMGDYYTAWVAYLQQNPPPTGTSMPTLVQQWCQNAGMSPSQAQTCATNYASASDDPIFAAQMLFAAAGGYGALMAYTKDITDVDAALNSSSGKSAILNSQSQSSVVTNTWAKGAIEGIVEDFFGGGSVTSESSTSILLTAGVSMEISFTRMATITVGPLAKGTVLAGPTTYQPWYVDAALMGAYTDNNNQVWQPGATEMDPKI